MNAVTIEQLTTRFGSILALDEVSIEVPAGRILAVLGPSGCGKTTLLRTIAGLERPSHGRILLGDRIVTEAGRLEVPAEQRGVGFVFQDYALFPHLSVSGNVGYGVRDRRHRDARVRASLELVGLGGLEDRYPGDLSGGQQQRVALARALAPEPSLILLDEPFSNLDADLRARVRVEVRDILRTAEATAIFVTHDQEEAFEIADLMAVMRDGRIEQIGPVETAYHTPQTRFVANFVGQASFVDATVDGGLIRCELGTFEIGDMSDGPAELLVRPEDIELQAGGSARVAWRRFQGPQNLYGVQLPSGIQVMSVKSSQTIHATGDPVRARFVPDHIVVFRGATQLGWVRARPRTGTDL